MERAPVFLSEFRARILSTESVSKETNTGRRFLRLHRSTDSTLPPSNWNTDRTVSQAAEASFVTTTDPHGNTNVTELTAKILPFCEAGDADCFT